MASNDLLALLKDTVLIADGGMGTMVQELSPRPVECVEALNLYNPDLIREIHKEFIAAGAVIIETNTFGANRFALEKFHLEEKVGEINRLGVEIAKSAARPGIFIAGSIGPIRLPGIFAPDEAEPLVKSAVIEQVKTLVQSGVDLIIIETYPVLEQLQSVLTIVKAETKLPVIASLSPGAQGATFDGVAVADAAASLIRYGADIFGLNCGHGIKAIENGIESIAGLGIPVAVMPNAGLPERVGGRLLYGVSEEYFAEKAVLFTQFGARIIGGCCGITPHHIRAASERLKAEKIVRHKVKRFSLSPVTVEAGFKEGAFLESIKKTSLPIICEIDPPSRLKTERSIDAICRVHAAGADAVSMAENPLATIRISNLAFAAAVKKRVNTKIILHLTGRDHNIIGLQSIMLGAHVLGIEGLLCVTGDPSHTAGGTSNVYDVDSSGLIKMAAQLNKGRKAWGDDAGLETDFSIGAALNANVKDYSVQVKRLKKKIEVGARFVMTQPLFESDKIDEVSESIKQLGVKVFIGIFPLISLKTAEYLHNEVPGISIPDHILGLLRKNEDSEYQRRAGIECTQELLSKIACRADGLYLIAPAGEPELLESIVNFIRVQLGK
jgi:methionine synthase I (cobalamin-dependent)/5,10-methylenetetrahydrofolate reductase